MRRHLGPKCRARPAIGSTRPLSLSNGVTPWAAYKPMQPPARGRRAGKPVGIVRIIRNVEIEEAAVASLICLRRLGVVAHPIVRCHGGADLPIVLDTHAVLQGARVLVFRVAAEATAILTPPCLIDRHLPAHKPASSIASGYFGPTI